MGGENRLLIENEIDVPLAKLLPKMLVTSTWPAVVEPEHEMAELIFYVIELLQLK